jgi:hypothetical protein
MFSFRVSASYGPRGRVSVFLALSVYRHDDRGIPRDSHGVPSLQWALETGAYDYVSVMASFDLPWWGVSLLCD